jgi:hypothetical protein
MQERERLETIAVALTYPCQEVSYLSIAASEFLPAAIGTKRGTISMPGLQKPGLRIRFPRKIAREPESFSLSCHHLS